MGIRKSPKKTVKSPKELSQIRQRSLKLDRPTTSLAPRQYSPRVGLNLPDEASTHSAALKGACIQRDLDRLRAENIELDTEWSKLFGDMKRADHEYDDLVQQLEKLEALHDIKTRQEENQKSCLKWLLRLWACGDSQSRPTEKPRTGKMELLEHLIKSVRHRRDHMRSTLHRAAALMQWIRSEIETQKGRYAATDDGQEAEIEVDPFLEGARNERKVLRKAARQNARDEHALKTEKRKESRSFSTKKQILPMQTQHPRSFANPIASLATHPTRD